MYFFKKSIQTQDATRGLSFNFGLGGGECRERNADCRRWLALTTVEKQILMFNLITTGEIFSIHQQYFKSIDRNETFMQMYWVDLCVLRRNQATFLGIVRVLLKRSGNFDKLTHVREFSFVILFFKWLVLLCLPYFLKSKFFASLCSAYTPTILLKMSQYQHLYDVMCIVVNIHSTYIQY